MIQLNPALFTSLTSKGICERLERQETVTGDYRIVFEPKGEVIDLCVDGKGVGTYANCPEGLSKAMSEAMIALFDDGLIDGFQVENEDAETYGYESFEILDAQDALQTYQEALDQKPDDHWFINVIGVGDIEDPAFI